MTVARASTIKQEREGVYAALQYAASFHCLKNGKIVDVKKRSGFSMGSRLKPFWLKTRLKAAVAHAPSTDCFLLFQCLFSRCTVHDAEGMVKGACARWVQIVRGPRPKSETWPSAKKHGKSAHPPPSKPKSHSPHVPVRQQSRVPEQVAADAAEEVHKLEAAVQVLGGENNVHAKPLVEALKAARAKSRVPPVSERLTSCRNFPERARKRVTRAEDLVAKAVEQKTVFMQEVEEAEERLKQLEAEESKPTPPSESGVMELQRRIEELVRERDALRCVTMQGVWCADGPSTPSHQYQVPIFKSCKGGSAHEIANCAMLWSLETRPPLPNWENWWVRALPRWVLSHQQGHWTARADRL